ncbi:hypothetical protein BCR33DRAFT_723175 [Rhizoclosmatium globosum]|uniref:Transmembrane protein n=1 Tax=Rhizoclosmatium globosum TaxID=329046 RepID=A0A1Y2BFL7_9FUNG|nr:hypothetical protein BCR33DRAFT_723175 [Rhizoclosmatium globosum]|eukprot:ORY33604.1 hypothetical protein BCR33DRAFT_723175 [Rhizoclosmatium globosum]
MPIDATNCGLVVAYHVWLVSVVRTAPHKTVYGVNGLSRKAWVATIMRGKNKDILAVQSLRNLIWHLLFWLLVVIIFGFMPSCNSGLHPETTDSKQSFGSQFGFVLDDFLARK